MSYELIAILLTTGLEAAGLIAVLAMISRGERWRDRIDAVLLKEVGDIREVLERRYPSLKH